MASREETETVITWTSADDVATVYTMHERIKKRCEKVGTEINIRVGIKDGKKVAWTYIVPIACISIRPRRTPSQAQLDSLSSARRGQTKKEVAS